MGRVSVFTLIERSVGNMGAVNPKVKDLAIELVILSYHKGINAQITSGLRTYAEQTKLYNQGRTTPGNIVTNAKAGQSIHNFGLAIDFVLVSEDGNKAYWDITRNMNGNQVADWLEVATIGKQLGFAWGGDWKSFKDYPHLDMQKGYSLASLRDGKRPTLPNVPKRSYQGVGDSGPDVSLTQRNLTIAGYTCKADGYFGDGTEDVVKAFQRANGLKADGFFGASSKAKLDSILKQGTKPENPAKPAEKPKEDEEMAEQAVVINGTEDAGTAILLAFQLGCGVYFRKDAEKRQVAKEIYIAGGGKGKIKGDKLIDLSGKTRSDTAKNVTAKLK